MNMAITATSGGITSTSGLHQTQVWASSRIDFKMGVKILVIF